MILLLLMALAGGGVVTPRTGAACSANQYIGQLSFNQVPSIGTYQASIWACGISSARDIVVDQSTGIVYVGSKGTNNAETFVVGLRDVGNTGFATEMLNVTEQIYPNGVDLYNGDLITTTRDAILKITNPYSATPTVNTLYGTGTYPVYNATVAAVTLALPIIPYGSKGSSSPSQISWHSCHVIGDYVYTSVGTGCALNCNFALASPAVSYTNGTVCDPCYLRNYDSRFATIMRFKLDGSTPQGEIVATGVRFSDGMDTHPISGDVWFTENGADGNIVLSAAPADGDEINAIPLADLTLPAIVQDYEYPLCEVNNTADRIFWGVDGGACAGNVCCGGRGDLDLAGIHSAPLGMRFYRGSNFPVSGYTIASPDTQLLFIADHGAATNTHPFISLVVSENNGTSNTQPTVFIDNFNTTAGVLWARPVAMDHLPDGSLLITDDFGGNIIRVVWMLSCGSDFPVTTGMLPGTCSGAFRRRNALISGTPCAVVCDTVNGFVLASGSYASTCINGSYTPVTAVCTASNSRSHNSHSHASQSHRSHSHRSQSRESVSHASVSHLTLSHSASGKSASQASKSHRSVSRHSRSRHSDSRSASVSHSISHNSPSHSTSRRSHSMSHKSGSARPIFSASMSHHSQSTSGKSHSHRSRSHHSHSLMSMSHASHSRRSHSHKSRSKSQSHRSDSRQPQFSYSLSRHSESKSHSHRSHSHSRSQQSHSQSHQSRSHHSQSHHSQSHHSQSHHSPLALLYPPSTNNGGSSASRTSLAIGIAAAIVLSSCCCFVGGIWWRKRKHGHDYQDTYKLEMNDLNVMEVPLSFSEKSTQAQKGAKNDKVFITSTDGGAATAAGGGGGQGGGGGGGGGGGNRGGGNIARTTAAPVSTAAAAYKATTASKMPKRLFKDGRVYLSEAHRNALQPRLVIPDLLLSFSADKVGAEFGKEIMTVDVVAEYDAYVEKVKAFLLMLGTTLAMFTKKIQAEFPQAYNYGLQQLRQNYNLSIDSSFDAVVELRTAETDGSGGNYNNNNGNNSHSNSTQPSFSLKGLKKKASSSHSNLLSAKDELDDAPLQPKRYTLIATSEMDAVGALMLYKDERPKVTLVERQQQGDDAAAKRKSTALASNNNKNNNDYEEDDDDDDGLFITKRAMLTLKDVKQAEVEKKRLFAPIVEEPASPAPPAAGEDKPKALVTKKFLMPLLCQMPYLKLGRSTIPNMPKYVSEEHLAICLKPPFYAIADTRSRFGTTVRIYGMKAGFPISSSSAAAATTSRPVFYEMVDGSIINVGSEVQTSHPCNLMFVVNKNVIATTTGTALADVHLCKQYFAGGFHPLFLCKLRIIAMIHMIQQSLCQLMMIHLDRFKIKPEYLQEVCVFYNEMIKVAKSIGDKLAACVPDHPIQGQVFCVYDLVLGLWFALLKVKEGSANTVVPVPSSPSYAASLDSLHLEMQRLLDVFQQVIYDCGFAATTHRQQFKDAMKNYKTAAVMDLTLDQTEYYVMRTLPKTLPPGRESSLPTPTLAPAALLSASSSPSLLPSSSNNNTAAADVGRDNVATTSSTPSLPAHPSSSPATYPNRLSNRFSMAGWRKTPLPQQSEVYLPAKVSVKDFDILRIIGKGAFGTVRAANLANDRSLTIYALKIMSKEKILKSKSIEVVMNERNILAKLKHPFVTEMYWACQDSLDIVIALRMCSGGDLKYHSEQKSWKLSDAGLNFYAGQLVLALRYIHSMNIVHRDLKPANILLDDAGNCHLSDFGVSAVIPEGKHLRHFCGTLDYMAPEVARRIEYGFKVDMWSLGATLYQLLFKRVIFQGKTGEDIEKLLKGDGVSRHIKYPGDGDARVVRFFKLLLCDDAAARLSSEDCETNDFFTSVNFDWEACLGMKMPVPFKPSSKANVDASFDMDEQLMGERKRRVLTPEEQEYFSKWDCQYNPYGEKSPVSSPVGKGTLTSSASSSAPAATAAGARGGYRGSFGSFGATTATAAAALEALSEDDWKDASAPVGSFMPSEFPILAAATPPRPSSLVPTASSNASAATLVASLPTVKNSDADDILFGLNK